MRGLDYYTKTAFEVSSESLGSQKAVAAGGRYDSMVEEFGGPAIAGIGFAIGMERIISLIKDSFRKPDGPDLFICPLGDEASEKGLQIAEQMRAKGLWVEINYDSASLRSQMRKANRIGARHVIVLGEDELSKGEIVIKNMLNGKETKTTLEIKTFLKIIQKSK